MRVSKVGQVRLSNAPSVILAIGRRDVWLIVNSGALLCPYLPAMMTAVV